MFCWHWKKMSGSVWMPSLSACGPVACCKPVLACWTGRASLQTCKRKGSELMKSTRQKGSSKGQNKPTDLSGRVRPFVRETRACPADLDLRRAHTRACTHSNMHTAQPARATVKRRLEGCKPQNKAISRDLRRRKPALDQRLETGAGTIRH